MTLGGHAKEILKCDISCLGYFEVNDRWIIFETNWRVVVFERGAKIHTCSNEWRSSKSVFTEDKYLYFANRKSELVCLDTATFVEKVVLQTVWLMNAAFNERDFLAISQDGVLQNNSGASSPLKSTFKHLDNMNWDAMTSVGEYTIIAGSGRKSLTTGAQLSDHNHFLLVDRSMRVANQVEPLAIEWKAGTLILD